jgi:transaldolase
LRGRAAVAQAKLAYQLFRERFSGRRWQRLAAATIAAFEDHGRLARTVDTGVGEGMRVMRRLATVGVDMDDVGLTLEDSGVAGFHESFQAMMAGLAAKASQLSRR